MNLREMAELVDAADPWWYAAWCERDGSDDELRTKFAELERKEK